MYVEEIEIYQNYVRYLKKARVRCLKILTEHDSEAFGSKLQISPDFIVLATPRRDLSTKKSWKRMLLRRRTGSEERA